MDQSVLHVEDDDAAAFLFRMALDEAELKTSVYRVGDGEHALEFLRKLGPYDRARTPALVVLDLNLPKVDGWTVLSEMQDDGALHSIPVIIVSTSPRTENRNRALAIGARHYIEKAFSFESFVREVKLCCGPFLASGVSAT